EIEILITKHQQNAAARELQKTLAKEVTVFVHGEEEYNNAIATTEKLFANQTAPAESLSELDLLSLEGIIQCNFSSEKINAGIDVVSFLAETTILPSKGEARKMVQNGGISINRKKVDNLQFTIERSLLLHQKYLLVQKGKKNYYLVKIQ
ncbi:MAG: tyrosine--tRNA ligase, partial [Bacteroidetes bacterium]|nr:tyrosine--tRNA ligase [Bacteroidota bacterium]